MKNKKSKDTNLKDLKYITDDKIREVQEVYKMLNLYHSEQHCNTYLDLYGNFKQFNMYDYDSYPIKYSNSSKAS